jgi:putative transposase
MTNIRRYYVPDSIVFITQVVDGRIPVFRNPRHLDLLREIMHEAQRLYPFAMVAFAFLPDHFHLLLKPAAGITHTQIMHSIKPNFTKAYKTSLSMQGSMKFWQKRYWDHIIRDEDDFANHLHYIHYNPVKHGHVSKPEDWPHSSFLSWKARGIYEDEWGWNLPNALIGFNDRDME